MTKDKKVYLLVYRSQPLAKLEAVSQDLSLELKEVFPEKIDLSSVDRPAGGLKLGKNLTPEKINKILDKCYEKMLS